MTAREFNVAIKELGFGKLPASAGLTPWHRTVRGNHQYVLNEATALSRAYRLFLGFNILPVADSRPNPGMPNPIEAESPWFEYLDRDKPAALEKCFDFLRAVGLQWLNDPYAMTPRQWREQHGMLIREHTEARVVVECDTSKFRTTDWIEFKIATALEDENSLRLKKLFVPGVSQDVGVFPLGRAMELKQAVERLGGRVAIDIVQNPSPLQAFH